MRLKAYAKINLTLDVTKKREDGYHNIDSIMQSVSLYDDVKVQKAEKGISVEFKGLCIDAQNNTAYKAAQTFFEYTKLSGGALIEIEKNIPACAGLGGGSADAAAVIVALDRLYETRLSERQLIEIGLKVGADVPFCIIGGTARVGSIGEEIEKLQPWENSFMLLAKRSEKKSTGQMYSAVDALGHFTEYTKKVLVGSAVDNYEFGNAFSECYEKDDLVALKQYNNPIVSLSGSGPTYFCIYQNDQLRRDSVDKLRAQGFTVYPVSTVGCSVEIIAVE